MTAFNPFRKKVKKKIYWHVLFLYLNVYEIRISHKFTFLIITKNYKKF